MDVSENHLILEHEPSSSAQPPLYELDLTLPFRVDSDDAGAKWNKKLRQLTMTLTVLPPSESEVAQAQASRQQLLEAEAQRVKAVERAELQQRQQDEREQAVKAQREREETEAKLYLEQCQAREREDKLKRERAQQELEKQKVNNPKGYQAEMDKVQTSIKSALKQTQPQPSDTSSSTTDNNPNSASTPGASATGGEGSENIEGVNDNGTGHERHVSFNLSPGNPTITLIMSYTLLTLITLYCFPGLVVYPGHDDDAKTLKQIEIEKYSPSPNFNGSCKKKKPKTKRSKSNSNKNKNKGIKYTWKETGKTVTVVISVKNVRTSDAKFKYDAHSVTATYTPMSGAKDSKTVTLSLSLAGEVVPKQCSHSIGAKNIVITLSKALPGTMWTALESDLNSPYSPAVQNSPNDTSSNQPSPSPLLISATGPPGSQSNFSLSTSSSSSSASSVGSDNNEAINHNNSIENSSSVLEVLSGNNPNNPTTSTDIQVVPEPLVEIEGLSGNVEHMPRFMSHLFEHDHDTTNNPSNSSPNKSEGSEKQFGKSVSLANSLIFQLD